MGILGIQWGQWRSSGDSGDSVGIQLGHPNHSYSFCHILPVHGLSTLSSRLKEQPWWNIWGQWGFSGNSGEIVSPVGTVGIQLEYPTHSYAFCHILPIHGHQLYHWRSRTNPEDHMGTMRIQWRLIGNSGKSMSTVEVQWEQSGHWGFSGNPHLFHMLFVLVFAFL